MFTVPLLILVAALIVFIIFIYCKLTKRLCTALFLKTGLSVLFILLASWGATRGAIQETGLATLAFLVLGGQVFGLLGDIWLDQRYVHTSHSDMYTVAGFTCFGIGHVLFIVGLLLSFGLDFNMHVLLPVIIAVAVTVVMILIEKPLGMDYRHFRMPVIFYTFIITAATVLAITLCVELRATLLWPMMLCFSVGMVLFLLSDLVLSQIYFSEKSVPQKVLVPLNLFFYYGAQFSIALSLVLISVA